MPVDARALTLHRPRTLKAALALLAAEPALTPIAGCTDVMVGLHLGTSERRQFIDLWPLDELRGTLIGHLQAPATKHAQLSTAPAAKFARVFGAYADQKAA